MYSIIIYYCFYLWGKSSNVLRSFKKKVNWKYIRIMQFIFLFVMQSQDQVYARFFFLLLFTPLYKEKEKKLLFKKLRYCARG